MGLETLILLGGIVGLLILMMRLSRYQQEVMQKLDMVNSIYRSAKIDTLDILQSLKEMNKGMAVILERESEIIDMINQMESQEVDIDRAFQVLLADGEPKAEGDAKGRSGPGPKPKAPA